MHTLLPIVTKVACNFVTSDMSALLAPLQVGFGVRGGVEAANHVVRCYVHHLLPGYAVVKLDFKNTFNLVHRAKMLKACSAGFNPMYIPVHLLCILCSLILLSSGEIRLFSS